MGNSTASMLASSLIPPIDKFTPLYICNLYTPLFSSGLPVCIVLIICYLTLATGSLWCDAADRVPRLRQPGPVLTAAQVLATADCPGLTSLQLQLMRQIMPRTLCSAGNAAMQAAAAAAQKAGLQGLSTLLHSLIQEDLHEVGMQQQQPDNHCQVDDDAQGCADTDHDNRCTSNNSSSRGYRSTTAVGRWQLPNSGLRGETARLQDENMTLKKAEPALLSAYCVAPHGISSSSSKCRGSVLSAFGKSNGKPPAAQPTLTLVSAGSPRPATTHLLPNSISDVGSAVPITHPTPNASCSTALHDVVAKPLLRSLEKLAVAAAASSWRRCSDSISNPCSTRHQHGAYEVSGLTQDEVLNTAAVLHNNFGPVGSTRHQHGAGGLPGVTQDDALNTAAVVQNRFELDPADSTMHQHGVRGSGAPQPVSLNAAAVVRSHSGPAGASSSAVVPVADFRDWEPWYAGLAALVE